MGMLRLSISRFKWKGQSEGFLIALCRSQIEQDAKTSSAGSVESWWDIVAVSRSKCIQTTCPLLIQNKNAAGNY